MNGIQRLAAALEGRYDIERELGEGGMATVYLARDVKHKRNVALKILKPELAAVVGAERFLAEIETTANLQHPHILPLFDSGETDSFLFYVMPYVEGETLRDRLDRERQLPVQEALAIVTAVAGALQTAHDSGVVHRDIKPGNILLSRGQPLVADFGIAIAVSAGGGGRLTETGLSLGTPYYMPPEQVTGDQHVGPASDTFALACVLYEMLTGEPPFPGSTAQAVLGKIIQSAPPSATLARQSVPEHVDAAIRKGLEKVPADRFVRVQDFATALGNPGFTHDQGPASVPTRVAGARSIGGSRGAPILWAVIGMLAVVAAWGWIGSGRVGSDSGSSPTFRSSLELGEASLAPGEEVMISPDGRRLAYFGSTDGASDRGAIFVRSADGAEFRIVPGTEGPNPWSASWSPDSEWLLYSNGSELLKVSVLGGGPVRLVGGGDWAVFSASWGADGTIVFSGVDLENREGIFRVASTGGPIRKVADMLDVVRVQMLPGERAVLLGTNMEEGGVSLLDLESSERRELVSTGFDPSYVASGHLMYVDATGGLWATPFDLESLMTVGDARPVLSGVTRRRGRARYSVSEAGTLVYGTGGAADDGILGSELVVVGLEGSITPVQLQPRFFFRPQWSPSGRYVAYQGQEPGNPSNDSVHVYVYDVDLGNAPTRLTSEGRWHGYPMWAPSGDRLVYAAGRGAGDPGLRIAYVDGTRPAVSLGLPGNLRPSDWPADDVIVFSNGPNIHAAQLDGDTVVATREYFAPEARVFGAQVSPDGVLVAYESDESGRWEIYVRAWPELGAATRITVNGGGVPVWSPDGSKIYFERSDTLFAAELQRSPTLAAGSVIPVVPWTHDWPGDIHPDGDRFIAVRRAVEEGQPAPPPERHIVVHNWFDELRRILGDGGVRHPVPRSTRGSE